MRYKDHVCASLPVARFPDLHGDTRLISRYIMSLDCIFAMNEQHGNGQVLMLAGWQTQRIQKTSFRESMVQQLLSQALLNLQALIHGR